jgi:hypothetical protein
MRKWRLKLSNSERDNHQAQPVAMINYTKLERERLSNLQGTQQAEDMEEQNKVTLGKLCWEDHT